MLSDSGEDAKEKGTRKVIFVFALSQFSGPNYLGACNRLLSVYLDHGRVPRALGCSNAHQNAIEKGPRQNGKHLIQFA